MECNGPDSLEKGEVLDLEANSHLAVPVLVGADHFGVQLLPDQGIAELRVGLVNFKIRIWKFLLDFSVSWYRELDNDGLAIEGVVVGLQPHDWAGQNIVLRYNVFRMPRLKVVENTYFRLEILRTGTTGKDYFQTRY